jgi:hypothetical protein
MGLARRPLLPALLLVAACSGSTAAPERAASTTTPATTPRLSPDASSALAHLASLSGPIDAAAAEAHDHTVTFASALSPADQATFDEQLQAAKATAARFGTTAEAAAAGYVQSATQIPGVGTHWVNWELVDRPFDPARPAMLLFDQSPLHETRLAGFSYWVRSIDPPDGFAGPNDVWHRHSGLCFENGWNVRENVPAQDECPGEWLNGSDLWMLHAWIAPDEPNSDGVFAPRNSALCPPDSAQLPDVLKCSSPGSPALPGAHGSDTPSVTDQNAYCHLPI